MYGLVAYQLSGTIHAGIQYGHAVVEYMVKYRDLPNLTKWAEEDKTSIILNGGTTDDNPMSLGTLNQHVQTLKKLGVKTATFTEPDLGDCLTAVVFLVPETVYDEELYPEPTLSDKHWIPTIQESNKYKLDKKRFIETVGKNGLELREFLKQFKLA
jgi:hypothetical protein